MTGVIVLPQRQTTLVAKQAAEVDLLSEGRLRLGVAVGWNAVEYAALGQDFATRGQRLEEQVGILRQLWTSDSVSVEGPFDTLNGVAIAPLSLQRPIPIWLGAQSAPAFRRVGRIAAEWFPQALDPATTLIDAKAVVDQAATEVGRDPTLLGMEARVSWRGSTTDLVPEIEPCIAAGATHVAVETMDAGLPDVAAHLEVLEEAFMQVNE